MLHLPGGSAHPPGFWSTTNTICSGPSFPLCSLELAQRLVRYTNTSLGCSAARGLAVAEPLEGGAHTRLTGVTCPVTIALAFNCAIILQNVKGCRGHSYPFWAEVPTQDIFFTGVHKIQIEISAQQTGGNRCDAVSSIRPRIQLLCSS